MDLLPEKFMSEADFVLEVEVESGHENEWHELARSVASEVATSGQIIEPPTAASHNNGLHFWILSNSKRIDGFDVWLLPEIEDEIG